MGWNTGERADPGVNTHNDHSPRFKTGLYESNQVQGFLWAPSGSSAGTVVIRKVIHYNCGQHPVKGTTFYVVFAVYSYCDFKAGIRDCGGRLNEWTADYDAVLKIAQKEIERLQEAGWADTTTRTALENATTGVLV